MNTYIEIETCPSCGGTGYEIIDELEEDEYPECHGSGEIEVI